MLVNHNMLADSPEKSREVLVMVRDLMIHVREETNDEYLLGVSVYMEAGCELYLDNPSAAMILLEDCNRPKASPEVILASALDRLGNRSTSNDDISEYSAGACRIWKSDNRICRP